MSDPRYPPQGCYQAGQGYGQGYGNENYAPPPGPPPQGYGGCVSPRAASPPPLSCLALKYSGTKRRESTTSPRPVRRPLRITNRREWPFPSNHYPALMRVQGGRLCPSRRVSAGLRASLWRAVLAAEWWPQGADVWSPSGRSDRRRRPTVFRILELCVILSPSADRK